MKDNIFEVVLLLALPASGKSEVRKYLEHLPHDQSINDFHMGPSVQLDDFPYVHMMRRIDDELAALNQPRCFFVSGEKPFITPQDWGTLIALINEDYADVVNKTPIKPTSAADYLFTRIDKAGLTAKIEPRLEKLDANIRQQLAAKLEKESQELLDEKHKLQAQDLEGKTVVIEFARGGPDGSSLPLEGNYGYQYSLAHLSPEILEKAVILYIWVTPEESRRKNAARSNPDDPGSILHHGVQIEVMLNDYGTDDMQWLIDHSEKPNSVTVKAHDKTFYLPAAKFDNRVDKTSFLREPQPNWDPAQVKEIHEGLKAALEQLAKFRS